MHACSPIGVSLPEPWRRNVKARERGPAVRPDHLCGGLFWHAAPFGSHRVFDPPWDLRLSGLPHGKRWQLIPQAALETRLQGSQALLVLLAGDGLIFIERSCSAISSGVSGNPALDERALDAHGLGVLHAVDPRRLLVGTGSVAMGC